MQSDQEASDNRTDNHADNWGNKWVDNWMDVNEKKLHLLKRKKKDVNNKKM